MRRILPALWILLSGCHHYIEPIEPRVSPPLEDELPYPAETALRIENGYVEPVVLEIRSEGFHHWKVDLRDWSARILTTLADGLARRKVDVLVPVSALQETSVAHKNRFDTGDAPAARFPTLEVWVLDVKAPREEDGLGPWILVGFESRDGRYSASFATTAGVKSVEDALTEVTNGVFADPAFRAWLERQGRS
jgi:hypothetical protein